MIEEKFVDLYARNSGIRDKLITERDVVLTYALKHLGDAKLLGTVFGGPRLHARDAEEIRRRPGGPY